MANGNMQRQSGQTMKYILRRGESHQLTSTTLAEAELGFNTDTKELMVGTKDGPVKVSDVVEGPEGVLYAPVPEGMIPLCIRAIGYLGK